MWKSRSLKSVYLGLLVSAFATPALAQVDNVKAWNGLWRSGKDLKPTIELMMADGKFNQLKVDGNAQQVTDVQVSPDQKTVLFSWEGGQGTLLRVKETAAEISLFAPKLSVRNAPVSLQPQK